MRKLTTKEYFDYLPKLNKDEIYLLYLISRDREAKEMGYSIDKILFRIKETDIERGTKILQAIRENVEFQVNGVQLKKEWVKIMHVLNPVNYAKASRRAVMRFVENCHENPNIEAIFDSELPRSVDFKVFMIDVDSKDKKVLEKLKGIKARLAITTQRGFHIHVWKDDLERPENLFKIVDEKIEIKTRDAIEYIPGMPQGKITPEAYEISDVEELIEKL
ncbi:MAG: hypothetical protein ASUL_09014 [Candidatus Aramenus sulfurataquae]|jgi:hypothetical protein|uniref:Uncharacterized protein n=2 Tax=Candidatus Aramenus sulfurataquae TaxID=1326980 RepID=W7KH39_9CREN|nr:MAG: hypothetical protein ASUL_09014 [Candidatus Aramenus sulfurataquae]